MFTHKSWAAAFVDSLEKEGGEIDEALGTLEALAAGADASRQYSFSGRPGVEKLEPALRNKMYGAEGTGGLSSSREIALRFFLLLVKKNRVHYADSVIGEIKNIRNRKRGILAVSVECAFPPEKELEASIGEMIKKRTGVSGVELTCLARPELIGGYRMRIRDEVIDASVLGQLRKMETRFAACNGVD